MTYILVRHHLDGKYTVRFDSERTQDYRQMLLCLRAYLDPRARKYDRETRTWTIEDKSGKVVDRWRGRMAEEFNPVIEFICEREAAWEESVKEAYRTLHILSSAPWELVQGAYNVLADLCKGDTEQLRPIELAYERLRQEYGKGASPGRGN